MHKRLCCWLLLFFITPLALRAASIAEKVDKLLHEVDVKEQYEIVEQIVSEDISPDILINAIKNRKFKKPEKTGIVRQKNLCIDGQERPYFLYVPSTYDQRQKTPLVVYLHGGVSRKDLIENFEEYVEESPFMQIADAYGYILLFPLGQFNATWWDSVGIANVLQQIRNTKQYYNIDDNRVFMTGFSDGGSGSFVFALCYPSYFAGFLLLNGHPGAGSWGGIQTYFINLVNRPIYVINTDEDELYPAEKMRTMMELAHSAGANVLYRIYTGIGHDFDYADEELPLMAQFMETHARSLGPVIKWESADSGFGCNWLTIDGVTDEGHANWYEDHNMELVDDRVLFGFFPDDNFEGDGVRVDKIMGDSTLCAVVGIQEGDVIVKLDDLSITSLDDVNNYKDGKALGDSVEITIVRGEETLTFNGQFPGPRKYNLFIRDRPSGRIEGYFSGNKFSFRTSQVGAFTIYIHPDMVQLNQNVVVEVNGKTVYDKKVIASSEFLLKNFLEHRDRALLYVNKVLIDLR